MLILPACGRPKITKYVLGKRGQPVKVAAESDAQVEYKDDKGTTKNGIYHMMPGDYITPAGRVEDLKKPAPPPPAKDAAPAATFSPAEK